MKRLSSSRLVFRFWRAVPSILMLVVFVWAGCVHAQPTGLEAITSFSTDYHEARNKFLDASHAAGARIESIESPVAGPEGEPIYIDVASLGAKNGKTVLVLGSGTHGVEGFAGSAIQTGLLLEGAVSGLKPDTSVVMIHAINPYGFAHLRRFNEDNVDLNRNFVDHSVAHPINEGYGELADALAPKSISLWENAKSRLKLFWFRLRNGKATLKQAVTSGQYSHPQGIFYGGQTETWSNKTLRAIARSYLSQAERVVFVDFHTGLGPYGHAEVISNEKQDSPAYQRAVGYWGDRVRTTATGEAVSAHLQGTLKLAIPKMLPHAEVTAVSPEFGTFPEREVLWALRAENWLHHHGGKGHPDSEEIKAELLRVFYPDEDDWKLKVWSQGREVVEQALAHMQ